MVTEKQLPQKPFIKDEYTGDQLLNGVFFPHNDKLYGQLLKNLPMAVYTCNKEGRITYYNDLAVKLWGYTPDIHNDTLKFCACFKVFLPDGTFLPPAKTPMAVALQTGQSFRNTTAIVERPDGSTFYASVNIDPLFDEQNNISGAINIFQDITDYKLTETALRESEAKYQQLVQALPAALYSTDAQGCITSFNEAAVTLWGRRPVIGRDVWCGSWKIYAEDGSPLPLDTCPMAITLKEGRAVRGVQIIIEREDGTRRYVAPHPTPVFNSKGKITGAVNMLIDITELKQSEQALLESEKTLQKKVEERTAEIKKKNEELTISEEKYHKMIEEVEDYAVLLLDKEGIIQNWNKGAEKIKGYKEQEIVGKNFRIFYRPEDQEKKLPEQLINEAITNGKAIHEGWRVRKNGATFWGSIVITALHNDFNEVIGFSKVTRDLTERKNAEDKIKQYASELEFQNKELQQFAYAAAHDMKEPLRKIQFYNTFLLDAEMQLPDKERNYLKRSIAAASRMQHLIDDLLTYSKNTGETDKFEPIDLNKIVADILVLHNDIIEETGAAVEIAPLPDVMGIPFQLAQLFDNLVGNALKYHHPQRVPHITISCEKVNGTDMREYYPDTKNDFYRISITDNGIGFEQEYSNKIFEMFQRLHGREDYPGTGIGLAICKKIVQNHHGFIHATGEFNQGARFNIYLPCD